MKATIFSFVLLTALSVGPAVAQGSLPSVARSGPTVATNSTDYKMVVGDKLRVEVYKDPQMSQSLQIRPDGKITLPLLGDVAAAGKTPAALRDSLTSSLKEFITSPVVTVIVVEAQPQTVSVIGEVNAPGTHPIKGQTTVIEALAMAGGFKDFANTKNITIQRSTPTGTTRIKFNYKDAIKSESKQMCVEPGDVIIVP
ncbi:MAG TPA: polysaccharide biosynthesis/export family protein [Vicinamibacterales bacterium]|nr:polysaccharide biosynthesis/export family protein [Vicinamibacterales bacterium]